MQSWHGHGAVECHLSTDCMRSASEQNKVPCKCLSIIMHVGIDNRIDTWDCWLHSRVRKNQEPMAAAFMHCIAILGGVRGNENTCEHGSHRGYSLRVSTVTVRPAELALWPLELRT